MSNAATWISVYDSGGPISIYKELETAFNEMMVALHERTDSRRGLEAEE